MNNKYSLFWCEEENMYQLLKDDELIGRIADDTAFANKVLEAFIEKERLEKEIKNAEWRLEKIYDLVGGR